MEYIHIEQIDFANNIGNRVYGVFLVTNVEVREQKNGGKYMNIRMADKGKIVEAKKFNVSPDDIERIKSGSVYYGAIDVKEYDKSDCGYSCIIYNIDISNEMPQAFIEWDNKLEWAGKVIVEAINSIENQCYLEIVTNTMKPVWDKFFQWKAASSMHHNVMGGLAVHTAEVVSGARAIAGLYRNIYGEKSINMDLVIAGALLHDVGKVEELSVDLCNGVAEYSNRAALESHLTISYDMITRTAVKLGIGEQNEDRSKTDEQIAKETEDLRLLRHIMLAHHGKREYGSPITPSIPEAFIVHKADEISAEMFAFNKEFKDMKNSESKSAWINGLLNVKYKDYTK
jgi:3'-5' exoribonuclease